MALMCPSADAAAFGMWGPTAFMGSWPGPVGGLLGSRVEVRNRFGSEGLACVLVGQMAMGPFFARWGGAVVGVTGLSGVAGG